jgi:formamidopyrimidine-DNA glycosylase
VGIGNIYSDEILWSASVNPERRALSLKDTELNKMFQAMKETLNKGIDFGGDSLSDYRNIYGLRGEFQMHHKAYRRTGQKCMKKNCTGVIIRKIIGGRSSHFCNIHQK